MKDVQSFSVHVKGRVQEVECLYHIKHWAKYNSLSAYTLVSWKACLVI